MRLVRDERPLASVSRELLGVFVAAAPDAMARERVADRLAEQRGLQARRAEAQVRLEPEAARWVAKHRSILGPEERASLKDLYLTAAVDDETTPLPDGKTRVQLLDQMMFARITAAERGTSPMEQKG